MDTNPNHLLLRRLHKVLTLPVKDLRDSNVSQETLDEAFKNDPKGKRKIYKGFYSILRKTLYSSDTKTRESLINIVSLCHETDLSTILFYLEDIDVIFQNLTSGMQSLLDNCFTKNAQCK